MDPRSISPQLPSPSQTTESGTGVITTGLVERHAVLIGIDRYGSGMSTLSSAVNDARGVAELLARDHGYRDPELLLDSQATGEGILECLKTSRASTLSEASSLVLYFAGHGVALDDGPEGPQGYLMPVDANSEDKATWLSMDRLRKALSDLACRHLLVLLDCCFAGSFRWASSRSSPSLGRPLYDSQYRRFVEGTAWQVLTSASHQELAADVAPGLHNTRDADLEGSNSPFAVALMEGLSGAADSSRGRFDPDGVITATELHQYIFEALSSPGRVAADQTPGLWPLKPENTGEFVFDNPQIERQTVEDPPLDAKHNPWLGLRAYKSEEADRFFGRERVVDALEQRLTGEGQSALLAVVGASGTGKSSVVAAGLVPRLKKASDEWNVVSMPRLSRDPLRQLQSLEREFVAQQEVPTEPVRGRTVLVIDQLEELYLRCRDTDVREKFLARLRDWMDSSKGNKVILTLRSDFEARLADSEALGPRLEESRFVVQPPTSQEFREIIEGPAKRYAVYFDSEDLIGAIMDEVMAMPGALAMLSFALSEMYRHAILRRRRTGALDRGILFEDYESAGKVVGSLHQRANDLYSQAGEQHRATIQRLFLRMQSSVGGRLARRRVEQKELEYADTQEQARVDTIVADYVEARLLVQDDGYFEPAHDTLVVAWERLTTWLQEAGSQQLNRQIWRAAKEWDSGGRVKGLLWRQDPRLPQAAAMTSELNALENQFVVASSRSKTLGKLLKLAAIVIFSLLIYSWTDSLEWTHQEKLREIARIRAEARAEHKAQFEKFLQSARQTIADEERAAAAPPPSEAQESKGADEPEEASAAP